MLSRVLAAERLVDLTQPLGPSTVLWPGSTPFDAIVDAEHPRDRSYYRTLRLSEHSGTHLDAPVHFAEHGRSTDELGLELLVRPAILLDVRERCEADPHFALSRQDVETLEAEQGQIPPKCAVLVCTGWDRYLGDERRYVGEPGALEFPGIGADAAELLVARGAIGVGIDTLSVDPGHVADFAAHRITQAAGLWHLEGLVRLDRVTPRGAWLVAGAIPLVGGSGCPVRAFAILPS
jgi:kynurenine formamidase